MLSTTLGIAIAGFLAEPAVVEVMLNPEGRLWIDRLGQGLVDTGTSLSPSDGERIIRLVAHHVGAEVHAPRPAGFGGASRVRRALRGPDPSGF
jgi:Flp pilus assembly CpaF family ATPase